jgi:polyhydroxybutyrate depolymerase
MGLAVVLVVTIVAATQIPSSAPASTGASAVHTTRRECPLPGGISELTVKDRQVSVYAPAALTSGPLPLILMFHGISSSPIDVEKKAKFQQKDPDRFLIVYPYGIGTLKAFNGAGCCDKNGPDDVAFAKEIVLEMEKLGCSQQYNAFVSGFSNGGFMSHRLGCEAGYRDDGEPWFRALAPHSGLLGSYNSNPYVCANTQKIPILSFHGAADKTVPITGANPNPLSPAVWQSFSGTRDSWADHNGCTDPVEVQRTSTTSCTTYTCPADTSVEFCLAEGLAHNWMGNQNTKDYDATKAVFFDFFAANMK